MSDYDVIVTTTIHASQMRVWEALTKPALVAQWMLGARVDSSWREGASITWSGEYDGKPYFDTGEVLEVAPGERLVHTHFSPASGVADLPENHHRLVWTLTHGGGVTTLTLIQSGARSQSEADRFRQNWIVMLDGLRNVAESDEALVDA